MYQSQEELRRAAAKAFMESLDQLESSLTTDDSSVPAMSPTATPHIVPANKPTPSIKKRDVQPISVEALEEAVADIEQFMQERQRDEEDRG